MTIRQTALLLALSLAGPGNAQAPAQASRVATASPPPAPTLVPSKDFPKGTATPSAECGTCHQAIFREYAEGFGSDMHYPGLPPRAKGDKVLDPLAGSSAGASAHAVSGTDPWPTHARQSEEEGKICNVCHFPQPWAIPDRPIVELMKPVPRPEAQGEGVTCAACHLTPEGSVRGPHQVTAPHTSLRPDSLGGPQLRVYVGIKGEFAVF